MQHRRFTGTFGIAASGALMAALAVGLQHLGNPANMGLCVACFERDIAGALGLHRTEIVQYLRPEIPALLLGSFIASLSFGEFKPRAGSSPLTRFILGMCAMIGALVFLGCPWRALLRLAGGDLNAVTGLAGLVTGIGVGTLFFRKGYSLGRNTPQRAGAGLVMPVLMLGTLALLLIFPQIAGEGKSGVLFYSVKGPGSMHAPLLYSLGGGLAVGFLAQRSRFCTMGAFRDLLMFRHAHLLIGVASFVAAAFALNLMLGKVNVGFAGQPVAHSAHLWNFLGMMTAGWAFALAGGCPGRQIFMAGEGDADAGLFMIGMIVAAAFAHNFGLASSPAGIGAYGDAAVYVCLIVLLGLSLAHVRKAS
ncbi:MAG: YedE-related selenium metabolism membrane protein [Desulfovibrio sp.]|jgi:YedE family putative selenium metabolism protein|nr:YedE-related selenium metabolism membrane protein [Desulfovibrio sp.]